MNTTYFLKARVSTDTKAAVQAAAEKDLITESIWLRRVVQLALRSSGDSHPTTHPVPRSPTGVRLSVTLRSEDRLLLHERATARQLPEATYVSVLVRAHLRHLAPLPKDELLALKRAVAELGAIGRNFNQIARVLNQGTRVTGTVTATDLRAILKICEALRDHVKALIKTNATSWEAGHAPTTR